MDYTYATLIVAAADQAAAQALLSPAYFQFPLSETGWPPPATHYATSGPFSNDELSTALNQQDIRFTVYFGSEPYFGDLVPVQEPAPEPVVDPALGSLP